MNYKSIKELTSLSTPASDDALLIVDSSDTTDSSSGTSKQISVANLTAGIGAGDVIGPASAVDGDIVLFNGVTGKLIKDGSNSLADVKNRANHTGTQTASTISDFDTEVSNNTDVSANTSARHNAVTVLDSSEVDFTLTGQQITASLKAGSIDETKLDTSTNSSLDLADSSVQPGDLSAVATSGDYNDLSNQPSIPSSLSELSGTLDDIANGTTYVKSENNYDDSAVSKLSSIASGAEVNVQSNWNTTASGSDSYIQNKPSVPSSLSELSGTLDDIANGTTYVKSHNDFTDSEQSKLSGIASGAEVNVNANWNATSGDAEILNKPSFATVATSGSYDDLSNKPSIPSALNELSGDSDDISEGTANLFMTTGERSKLSGIASGAEVNVQSDWNVTASGNDAYIKNKPTLSSPLTTKGDIWVYSTDDTRLPVGTNGQVLSADSTQSAGLKWVDASGGGGGTVTSVSAGSGMDFSEITGAGSVVLGTPSNITGNTTNVASGTTHTHQVILNLNDLDDATITSVANNELLAYDTTASGWINQTPSEAGFSTVATSGSYNDLSNLPSLSTVATSGSYNDLSDKPAIPSALSELSGDSDDIAEGSSNLFMTTGERSKLSGIASGAEVNVNSDWNATSGDAEILNKPTLPTGNIVGDTDTQTLTNKTIDGDDNTILDLGGSALTKFNGWIPANETWTYVSVDDPSGTFKVNADVTTKYYKGMRLRMTNGGHQIDGIVTLVGPYGGTETGYTYVTFLHKIDPTDSLALYLMANSAITNNFYSHEKVPAGFSIAPENWQIKVSSISRTVTGASAGTYYACSTTKDIPIGKWKYDLHGQLGVRFLHTSTGTADTFVYVGLSSSSGSITEQSASYGVRRYNVSGSVSFETRWIRTQGNLNLSAKTTHYVVGRATDSITDLWIGSYGPFEIVLTCEYL